MTKRSGFAWAAWIAAVLVVAFLGCTVPVGPEPSEEPPGSAPGIPADGDGRPRAAVQRVTIDFDAESPGYAGGSFAGSGIVRNPPPGYLDAQAWQILGFSDGDLLYGEEATTGDFARGISTGGVSTGGLYAFVVEEGNVALGVQPTATDFCPGSISLRIPVTLDSVEEIELAYTIWVYNDQNRSSSWTVAVSVDGEIWVDLPQLTLATDEEADPAPQWRRTGFAATVPAGELGIARGAWIHIRWSGADHGGTGGRDEAAIDDISVTLSGTMDE